MSSPNKIFQQREPSILRELSLNRKITVYASAGAITGLPANQHTHINRMSWNFRAITPDTDWFRIHFLNRAARDAFATR
jgi:hypothetical protein